MSFKLSYSIATLLSLLLHIKSRQVQQPIWDLRKSHIPLRDPCDSRCQRNTLHFGCKLFCKVSQEIVHSFVLFMHVLERYLP